MSKKYCFFILLIICVFSFRNVSLAEEETFVNTVRWPYSDYYDPFMGLILAFALELSDSPYEGEFGWGMEFNYFLPQNESEYTYTPIIGEEENEERGFFNRRSIYQMIEAKLDSVSGSFGGKSCFLRVICDMAQHTTKDTDVLGDIMHILLSPSSSKNMGLPKKYSQAENYGLQHKHCKRYTKRCPLGLLDFISVLGEILDKT